MEIDTYESFIRLMWDPDGAALVLVDYGDPLWGPIELDGEQMVQIQPLIRALGVRAIPRGNESHTLAFDLCRDADDMPDAFAARLNGILALPRDEKPVLISLEDGRNWRLKNCAVQSWPGGQVERFTRERIQIIGGNLVADEGVYAPGQTWGEISFNWEDLG